MHVVSSVAPRNELAPSKVSKAPVGRAWVTSGELRTKCRRQTCDLHTNVTPRSTADVFVFFLQHVVTVCKGPWPVNFHPAASFLHTDAALAYEYQQTDNDRGIRNCTPKDPRLYDLQRLHIS